jgi:hypothetical protein
LPQTPKPPNPNPQSPIPINYIKNILKDELNQINLKIINKKLKITINEINIIYTLLFQIIFIIFR